jgi:hypothetical protein
VLATVTVAAGTTGPGFFYPGGQATAGASAINHVTGMANMTVQDVGVAPAPLNLTSYQPVAAGTLCNLAQALPAAIPATVHPSFQISRTTNASGEAIPGRLDIRSRTQANTVGAVECGQ